jgi:hypothetical protein
MCAIQQESFDGVYAIEATCHAPERRGVYGEIMKVLKPGGVFACYEWCLTDEYDKVLPFPHKFFWGMCVLGWGDVIWFSGIIAWKIVTKSHERR